MRISKDLRLLTYVRPAICVEVIRLRSLEQRSGIVDAPDHNQMPLATGAVRAAFVIPALSDHVSFLCPRPCCGLIVKVICSLEIGKEDGI